VTASLSRRCLPPAASVDPLTTAPPSLGPRRRGDLDAPHAVPGSPCIVRARDA
jgi:hypothetical protein